MVRESDEDSTGDRTTHADEHASPGYTILCAAALLLATSLFAQTTSAVDDDAGVDTDTDIAVTAFGTVDMAVQDADLVQVLEMLSINPRRTSSPVGVSATVTAISTT